MCMVLLYSRKKKSLLIRKRKTTEDDARYDWRSMDSLVLGIQFVDPLLFATLFGTFFLVKDHSPATNTVATTRTNTFSYNKDSTEVYKVSIVIQGKMCGVVRTGIVVIYRYNINATTQTTGWWLLQQ